MIIRSPDDYWRDELAEVASLYYLQGLTQSEIGRRFNMSRSTVSRLLQRARDTGVVTIAVNFQASRNEDIEAILKATFGLKQARVLSGNAGSFEAVRDGIGKLASGLLDHTLQGDSILGVSYGRSIANTVEQVRPNRHHGLVIVPVIGALGSDNPLIEGIDLTRQLATKLGAKYRYLHAPLLVEDQRTRDLFMQEPTVNDVLQIAARSDCVIMGIGSLQAQSSGIIWNGYINRKERDWLHNIGVVGHMCAQFFDVQGQVLDIGINRRSISIGLDALKSIPNVIAIAGTADKASAILGALNGGYIDCLVTDEQAARLVLQLAEL